MTDKIKIKVDNFRKTPIYFDKYKEIFYASRNGIDYQNKSLFSLKADMQEDSLREFKGTFFLKTYDGIDKFKARTKFIDKYDGKTYVAGDKIDGYHRSIREREKVELKDLYPITPHNKAVFKKFKDTKDEGWRLIRVGENYREDLKKK